MDQNLILAPADGKVMGVTELENDDFVNEPCKKVTIFLSVFDVHVNFSPMAGKIKFQERIKFIKKVNYELSMNVFFDEVEAKDLIKELSGLGK